MNEYKLLLVPGDGIGPEVMDATMRVVGWFGQKGLAYKTEEALLGGVYFGEPKQTTNLPDGQKRAVDTGVYTTGEIERVCRVAFDMARLRGNKVHSAEKSNVMVTGVLWKEVITVLHAREYPDVE